MKFDARLMVFCSRCFLLTICHDRLIMQLICWLLMMLCFSLILDNERWKQADVPAEFQDLVDHIGNSGRC